MERGATLPTAKRRLELSAGHRPRPAKLLRVVSRARDLEGPRVLGRDVSALRGGARPRGRSARKVALLRDEATSRRAAGDLPGVSRALAKARQFDTEDAALQQEYAASVLERVHAGDRVTDQERVLATELLVALAEQFDGEHGLAYAGAALDADPAHDRALQLFVYYARSLRREEALPTRFARYLETNPRGTMATEARQALATSYEAAGQIGKAVELLEPLRAAGDVSAATKIDQLMAQGAPRPPMPSARPPQVAPPPALRVPAPTPTPQGLGAPPPQPTPLPLRELREPGEVTCTERQCRPRRRRVRRHRRKPFRGSSTTATDVGKGKKPDAFVKYKDVLEIDPSHPEALSWAEDYLRSKRDYAQLRDVLVASVRAMTSRDNLDTRKERLRRSQGSATATSVTSTARSPPGASSSPSTAIRN